MAAGRSSPIWRKSTVSGLSGCVEVAFIDGGVLIRDSKDPTGPSLRFSNVEWAAFVQAIRQGDFCGTSCPFRGRFSWSAGEGWAESAAGEVGHGDERVGAVIAIGAADE